MHVSAKKQLTLQHSCPRRKSEQDPSGSACGNCEVILDGGMELAELKMTVSGLIEGKWAF
jgi:hypothetical protein